MNAALDSSLPASNFPLSSLSYTCFSSLLFLLSSPLLTPPPLDVGARWSANGVYREPAFTTSEAYRQVSSAFCPTEGLSLSLSSVFPLTLLSITAIFDGFICWTATLHRVPRWAKLAEPWVFFCLSLMCASVQQAPFFCQGTSETSDLDGDNSSRQAGVGYIPKWFWGEKNGGKSEIKTPSAVTASNDQACLTHSLCTNTVKSCCSPQGGKHTTFLDSSLPTPPSTSQWCTTIASESDGDLL